MSIFEADLSAFADDWRLADKAECTVQTYLGQLRKYARWCEEQDLQTPSMRAAKSFLVQTKQRSTATAYMASRALKAFEKWYGSEYQTDDPFNELKFVKEAKPTPQRTATVADVDKLLWVCGPDMRGVRDRALIGVLASSGMRRTECASMMWGNIDLGTGTVTVPQTKAGRPRVVRLDRDAQRSVRRYWHALTGWEIDTGREESDLVWVSTTRCCGPSRPEYGRLRGNRHAEQRRRHERLELIGDSSGAGPRRDDDDFVVYR